MKTLNLLLQRIVITLSFMPVIVAAMQTDITFADHLIAQAFKESADDASRLNSLADLYVGVTHSEYVAFFQHANPTATPKEAHEFIQKFIAYKKEYLDRSKKVINVLQSLKEKVENEGKEIVKVAPFAWQIDKQEQEKQNKEIEKALSEPNNEYAKRLVAEIFKNNADSRLRMNLLLDWMTRRWIRPFNLGLIEKADIAMTPEQALAFIQEYVAWHTCPRGFHTNHTLFSPIRPVIDAIDSLEFQLRFEL